MFAHCTHIPGNTNVKHAWETHNINTSGDIYIIRRLVRIAAKSECDNVCLMVIDSLSSWYYSVAMKYAIGVWLFVSPQAPANKMTLYAHVI